MKYNKTVEKILNLLKQGGFWFQTFEHIPVRTSEEAAKIRKGFSLKQGAKTIIVRVKTTDGKKYFTMIVIPGDKRFDNTKVKSVLHAKDIRFATEDEVSKITGGVLPGGVPPFGNLFGLTVYTDIKLFDSEKIVFNAGDRRFSIAMESTDYKKIVQPEIVSIV